MLALFSFILDDVCVFVFLDSIRPICLPINEPLRSREFFGDNAFIAGWGGTSENGDPSPVLMQLQIPVVGNQKCRYLLLKAGVPSKDIHIRDDLMCAGEDAGKGFWHGDSGRCR